MSSAGLGLIAALCLGVLDPSGDDRPPIGAPVADFAATDCAGGSRRLDDWRDRRVVAVVFLAADCPVAELYAARLAELDGRYGPRGVGFLGIAPGDGDSDSSLADFAASHGIRFPILRDARGEIVDRLGAGRTPEVVVLDHRRVIRYRGRVDDQYSVGSRRREARSHDLVDALEDLLGGRPVARPETLAVGCPIRRAGATPPTDAVTYHRDIAPILRRRCVECHRPGRIGPFSLTNYREAAGRVAAIAEAVDDGRMPPWHADPRHGTFANDARLTDGERRMIANWASGGAVEGVPAGAPDPAPHPGDWGIPGPDLVVSMPRPFLVPAGGVVDYQTFEVDPGFREDRWVRAAEIRPGNRGVVHHCTVYLRAPGSRGDADAAGELGSFCLAATTPGAPPMVLPDGMAKRIPAGWRLVFVVHYAPKGTAQEDRTSIGLVFADPRSVRKEVATNLLRDDRLAIPPRVADHRVEQSRRLDRDVLLLSMFPHMHLRGRSFRYEATYPDGRREILLDVPRYDIGWQNSYRLAEPKRLPAGTVLRCIAHYDNSAGNPANPDPDATVRTGRQIWDEMFNGYYDVALADQDLTRPVAPAVALLGTAREYAGAVAPLMASASAALLLARRVRSRRSRRGAGPRVIQRSGSEAKSGTGSAAERRCLSPISPANGDRHRPSTAGASPHSPRLSDL